MSKLLVKYFYFLILSLNGILAFANSDQSQVSNNCHQVLVSAVNTQNFKFEVKKPILVLENFKDKIEFFESEVENEEASSSNFISSFDFFANYFVTKISGNATQILLKMLTNCKHFNYLSTIISRHVIFCVYRI